MKLPKKLKINLPKLNARQKIVGVVIIIVMAVGIFMLFQTISSKKHDTAKKEVSCADITSGSRELISQSKYKAAQDMLKTAPEGCDASAKITIPEDGLKAEGKAESIQHNRDMAVAAHESGDTKQAKVYAEQAIAAKDSITDAEFAKLLGQTPTLNSALQDVFEIQHDTYTPHAKFTETKDKTWE